MVGCDDLKSNLHSQRGWFISISESRSKSWETHSVVFAIQFSCRYLNGSTHRSVSILETRSRRGRRDKRIARPPFPPCLRVFVSLCFCVSVFLCSNELLRWSQVFSLDRCRPFSNRLICFGAVIESQIAHIFADDGCWCRGLICVDLRKSAVQDDAA